MEIGELLLASKGLGHGYCDYENEDDDEFEK
jgi:hypothetical protein